ncbi:MAG: glycoside hydrolase family 30 protein [Bacteroidales bacterium]|nr:glycoside hydrolase family 30 protein [Bacteroidales bacterium]
MRVCRLLYICLLMVLISCNNNMRSFEPEIWETSAGGHKLEKLTDFRETADHVIITIRPEESYQKIIGFGGSFTEASATILNRLGKENRNKILEAYFGDSGSRCSLTRTHINSCDFSLGNYSYAQVPGDLTLEHFSINEDADDIIPMIKDAMAISREGFKIISSPWTAPPWMKDNNAWEGGRLLPDYYETWALFFKKYIEAYQAEGIEIWGITVENEPLGNDNNWESMHFTPVEMNDFVKNHLGPTLRTEGHTVRILGYDQNRDTEFKEWIDAMYDDTAARHYYDGSAIHWYGSTYDYFPEMLQFAHGKAPDKHIIQTEACIDAQVPRWEDDQWYWSEEATDWGWDWAPPEKRHLHPKYVPVFRYAGDIIGCLNNHVDGWIDWNMVLDRQGGPNWAENWCIAPVIADTDNDEIYFTPLYFTLAHFSRFIRPDAVRIGFDNPDKELMVTAAINPDGSVVVVIFNPTSQEKGILLSFLSASAEFTISAKAIQTVVIPSDKIQKTVIELNQKPE